VLPMQCRMARAALGWTAQELAQKAGVGVNTVSRFENRDADASADSLARMTAAFQAAGIRLIGEDEGGGPGVRLNRRTIQIIRNPLWHPVHERFAFRVACRGQKVMVFLPRSILDELDRHVGSRPQAELAAAFERHLLQILQAVARAIDAGKVEHDSSLYLHPDDFTAMV
jgi:transcriptional regulator with XRE-family HTH domain